MSYHLNYYTIPTALQWDCLLGINVMLINEIWTSFPHLDFCRKMTEKCLFILYQQSICILTVSERKLLNISPSLFFYCCVTTTHIIIIIFICSKSMICKYCSGTFLYFVIERCYSSLRLQLIVSRTITISNFKLVDRCPTSPFSPRPPVQR